MHLCDGEQSCMFVAHTRATRSQAIPRLFVRRLEYSASASLQLVILLLISGGRGQSEIACVFVLMSMVMACGYFTETISRPDPASGGTMWTGDLADGSNKFRNYCWRMQAHVIGFVPYFTAWAVVFDLVHRTPTLTPTPTL